ncbi:hypothetical protein Tco_0894530 [Tanacetum coccineum]|uniref:Uncharacterized protein n=1 Tax=Tanacetum coccineum TaxID=301880 RepID=A0ABQ5CDA9_9ASTR
MQKQHKLPKSLDCHAGNPCASFSSKGHKSRSNDWKESRVEINWSIWGYGGECGAGVERGSLELFLIKSNKIDFLPEEFAGKLDLIDPIIPGIDEDDCDEDDFDEEEGEIDIDILQIEDEILRENLLNVNLLIDKINDI